MKKKLIQFIVFFAIFLAYTKILYAKEAGECCNYATNDCGTNAAGQTLKCDHFVGVFACPGATGSAGYQCRVVTTNEPSYQLPKYCENGVPCLKIPYIGAIIGKEGIGHIINAGMPYFFGISGLLLFFYLLYGAFTFLSSMGQPQGMDAGKTIMTRALMGFALIFSTYWLIELVSLVLGLSFL